MIYKLLDSKNGNSIEFSLDGDHCLVNMFLSDGDNGISIRINKSDLDILRNRLYDISSEIEDKEEKK